MKAVKVRGNCICVRRVLRECYEMQSLREVRCQEGDRREGISRPERNVKVGQVQWRHQLVKDKRSRSAIIHVDVMFHHYGRRM